jgi:hypothetical protein
MLRSMRLSVLAVTALVGVALLAPQASANTQVKTVNWVDDTSSDSGICAFDVTFHVFGSYKNVDYYDNSGFLYKTVDTPGGGSPFTETATANGTTLTQQNEAFSVVVTYNPDGSTNTYTQRGPFDKFTTPGGGIVLLDTGTVTFQEPEENVIFSGGPHQAVNGEFDAFCAAFG